MASESEESKKKGKALWILQKRLEYIKSKREKSEKIIVSLTNEISDNISGKYSKRIELIIKLQSEKENALILRAMYGPLFKIIKNAKKTLVSELNVIINAGKEFNFYKNIINRTGVPKSEYTKVEQILPDFKFAQPEFFLHDKFGKLLIVDYNKSSKILNFYYLDGTLYAKLVNQIYSGPNSIVIYEDIIIVLDDVENKLKYYARSGNLVNFVIVNNVKLTKLTKLFNYVKLTKFGDIHKYTGRRISIDMNNNIMIIDNSDVYTFNITGKFLEEFMHTGPRYIDDFQSYIDDFQSHDDDDYDSDLEYFCLFGRRYPKKIHGKNSYIIESITGKMLDIFINGIEFWDDAVFDVSIYIDVLDDSEKESERVSGVSEYSNKFFNTTPFITTTNDIIFLAGDIIYKYKYGDVDLDYKGYTVDEGCKNFEKLSLSKEIKEKYLSGHVNDLTLWTDNCLYIIQNNKNIYKLS